MSIKKTVGAVASRLSKESGGGKGINNEGELHHIEIHPAENGWRVEHHKVSKYAHGYWGVPDSDPEEHVFTSHHAACKHCKSVMEEHEGGMEEMDKAHSGKPIGKKDKSSMKDSDGDEGKNGRSG